MTEVATASRPLAAAARSDAGRVRPNNEDLAVLDLERGVLGVIDGVGGHAAGELAAAIARDVILQRLARPLGTPAERVREAIAIANNEIFRRAQTAPDLAGMTCVVTLALVGDGRITVGHVGDTRLYKLRPGGVRKLTHDHSPVGEREDAQELDELEAMRHPRRHEVFRDVGSALRDKDEPDYVEVIEDVLEDDAAILVCSDGLTDMIPSTAVERLVRRHAGDVDAVTAALVVAANEAGGRDNVTVVYAEGARFAAAVRASGAVATVAPSPSPVTPPRSGSPVLWFVAGLLLGLLGIGAIAWRAAQVEPVGGRIIAAAPAATETVGTLAAALLAARAGDTIRLEPGTYPEQVVLPDGVSLRARVPGSVVLTRAANVPGEWVAITAVGEGGGSVAGLRISSTAAAPMQVGLRVRGQGRSLELLDVEGPMTTAIDVAADASATLQGAHLRVPGPAIVLGARAYLDVAGSAFVSSGIPAAMAEAVSTAALPARSPAQGAPAPRGSRPASAAPPPPGPPARPAIVPGEGARVRLIRNVFVGFGLDPVSGLSPADRELVRTDNVVTTAASSAVR